MAEGFALAQAFVRIRPTTTGFRAEATAGIKSSLVGLDPSVPVSANTDLAKQKVADLQAFLGVITKKVWAARMVADDAGLQASLAKIYGQLLTLSKRIASPKIRLEGATRAEAQLLGIAAQMDSLTRRALTMHVDMESADAVTKIAFLITQTGALASALSQLRANVDDGDALAKIEALRVAAGELQEKLLSIDFSAGAASLAATAAEAEGIFGDLNKQVNRLTTGLRGGSAAAQAFGGWWGFLGRRVTLFGGAFNRTGVAALASVSMFHALADGVIELLAVLIPASVALIAFGAGAEPNLEQIFHSLQSIQTVTLALGQNVKPMTGGFVALGDALRPDVYQLYGDALGIINNRLGAFHQLAIGTGGVVDQLAARLEAAVEGSGFTVFLAHAISDVQQLGEFFGNVFGIIGNLLRTMPGYAQLLLRVLVGLSGALEALTSSGVVQWLIKAGLAMHGFWLYTGLAVTAVIALGRWLFASLIPGLAQAIISLGKWVFAVDAASGAMTHLALVTRIGFLAGIAVLAAYLTKITESKGATAAWADSLEQGLNKVSYSDVIPKFTSDIGQLNAKLRDPGLNSESWIHHVRDFFTGDLFTNFGANTKIVQASLGQMDSQFNTTGYRLGEITHLFGGLAVGMAGAQMAGVKVSQVVHDSNTQWAQALIQIRGMLRGYAAMGIQAGAAGNAVAALNVQAGDQYNQVQKLNQAWTAMMGVVSGGEDSFTSFAQDMLSANKALAQTGGTARTVTGTFPGAAAATNKLRDSFTGLNAASLQVRSTWQTSITGAQSYFQALQQQAAVAQDGAHGEMLLTQAGKDLLAILMPAARGSATLRDQVYLLAQEIGYKGVNSVKALSDYIGKGGGLISREKDLERVNAALGASVSNVDRDYQKMASTLQGDVSGMLEKVALGSSGAARAASRLDTALHHQGAGSQAAQVAYQNLISDLEKAGLSYKQAYDYAQAFTRGLHYNAAEVAGGESARNTLINQTLNQIAFFNQIKSATQQYNDVLSKNTATSQAGQTARTRLINDLIATGTHAQVSQQAIAGLIAKIIKIPGSEALKLVMSGSGHYSITGNTINVPGTHKAFFASGGRVPGFGGGDRHLIAVEGGEAIVDKHRTRRYSSLLGAMGVPGFAAGGLVTGGFPTVATQAGQFYQGMAANFQQTMVNAMVSDMKTGIQQARQAVLGGQFYGGGNIGQWMAAAMKLTGVPNSWLSPLELIAYHESTDNPNAINLTDSNAAAGDPSRGIMQVIGTTFQQFHAPGTSWDIYNPVANIAAAIRYILARYGSVWNVPGVRSVMGGGGYVGYDNGGILRPGLNVMYNGLPHAERLIRARGGDGAAVSINVYVDPAIAAVTPDRKLGQAIGQHILQYTKSGGRLYPAGVTPK